MKTHLESQTKITRGLAAAAVASLVLAASANPITPVAWKQSNASTADRTATVLGNATGMNGTETLLYNQDGSLPGEPTSVNNVEWNCRSESFSITVVDDRKVWVVVDLGAVYDLNTIHIWNFQWNLNGSTDLSNRGISGFDVYVRNAAADTDDGTLSGVPINTGTVGALQMTNAPAFNLGTSNPWELALENQALAQAPNTDEYAGESYDLTGNTGRFIAIVANGWYEGVSAGLGKVRIDGTPPPPTGGWAIDGGGSFNLNTNWSDNLVPTTNAILGDALTAPNAPAAVTLDSPVSLAQVSFINPNTYSLDGPSTLTLTSIATLNASIGSHNITAPIAGSAGVFKTGEGTVVLGNASNSYTGNTTVAEGVLAATDLGAINQASGVIDIAVDSTFALAGDGAGNGANGTLTEVVQGAGLLLIDRSLTTEMVTLGSANPGLSGQVQVSGGIVKVGNPGALGDTTGTTLVTGGDDFDTSALLLDNMTITGETLEINARKESAADAPHLISTGTSVWAGPLQGNTGGGEYNIQSQSGLFTLTGDFDPPNGGIDGDVALPSVGGRSLNLTGNGDVRIEGGINDVTGPGDGGNITLSKLGTGTTTIATIPTGIGGEGYHQGRTIIDEGTLVVESSGINEGVLFSRTIEVANGATFDISSFTDYELQELDSGLGQIISGAGTVNLGGTGSTLTLYPDSTISPGDTPEHENGEANQDVPNGSRAIGTLTITGDVTDFGGTFEMEVAEDGSNDTLSISGAAELAGTINVTGIPTVPLADGTVLTLISAPGGITNDGISFGPLPSTSYVPNITATTVELIWSDLAAPTVVEFSPNGVSDVPASTNLVATFDEFIKAGSGDITIKNLTDGTDVTIPVTDMDQVEFDESILTINPTANLLPGKQYAIQIAPTAITDLGDNPYAGIVAPDTTTWSFATDNTPPLALSISPAGVTNATQGTRLLVQFDKAVQVGSGSLSIRKTSDNSVVETIEVSTPGAVVIDDTMATVIRSVTLEPNTAYYVNAPAGVFVDINGSPSVAISDTTTWAFSTAAMVPILAEDFSASSDPLDGTSADTFSSAITSAGGSPIWGAASGFLQNGEVSVVGAGSSAYLNLGSYINNAKGTTNGRFELVMTISETSGAWISLGFAAENTPSTTKNFTNTGPGADPTTGLATIIYRAQDSATPGELDMFRGPRNSTGVDGPDGNTGFRRFTVTLDLTPAGGYNGTDNFGTVTWSDGILGVLGNSTYTADQDFGAILISPASNSSGSINALALYQEGVTPPDDTYSTWINSFAFSGFVDPDLSPSGDPDIDGVPNDVENLFGTSPEVFSAGLTTVSSDGSNLVFQHTLSTTPASDLTGSYEWSTDLTNWNASGVSADGTTVTFGTPVVITPGTPNLVEVTATVTGTPATEVFARFRATQD